MDNQIINELAVIKGLLVWVVILLTLMLSSNILKALSRLILNLRANLNEAIRINSISMFDKAEYDNLVKYLEPKLKKKPNNATATFWLARAYLEQGNTEMAKGLFLKLKHIEPAWEEEFVSPYLDRINEQQ